MPVRVSVAAGFSSVVVAARADTVRFCFVAERTDVRVAVVLFSDRGNKTETGFVARGATTVFTGVLDVTDRVARMAVAPWAYLLRTTVFSPRDAASALNMQNRPDKTKSRIFFISSVILANL